MINIPLDVLPEPLFPPTELTGAGALLELEQPASQSETSDNAATRLMVNLGLPALIYPRNVLTTSDLKLTVMARLFRATPYAEFALITWIIPSLRPVPLYQRHKAHGFYGIDNKLVATSTNAL